MPERTGQSEPASALLTSSDVLTLACACYGAILPLPLSRLDAIPGQEHLRPSSKRSALARRARRGEWSGRGFVVALTLGCGRLCS